MKKILSVLKDLKSTNAKYRISLEDWINVLICFLFYFFFQGTPIEWKKGKNVTVKTIKKKQKHKSKGSVRTVSKTVQNDSFFNFFSPPSGMLFNLNIVGSVCSYELL
jgi:hypothetical protein